MLRAIYIGDIAYEIALVFEYNILTNRFHAASGAEQSYSFDEVMHNPEWLTFAMGSDTPILLDTARQVLV